MTSKPRFEIHVDTRLLYQRIIETPIGGTVTYADLGAAISRTVTGADYNLQSALRMARRDDGAYFDNIHGVGYRRMTADDIASSGINDVTRMRRMSRRAVEKQMSIKTNDLAPDRRKVQLATLALLGAVTQFTSRKAISAASGAVEKAGREIPLADTLRLFSTDK